MRNLLLSAMLLLYCVACQGQKQRDFIYFEPLRLKPLAASDSIGPWPLEPSISSPAQVRIKLNDKYPKVDTIDSHFLIIERTWETPRVLYRANVADTTWLELGGLLDQYAHGYYEKLEIRQANLDGVGQPEALLVSTSAIYGNSGNSYSTSIYLLDVSAYPPRLLLRAKTGLVHQTFRLVNQKIDNVHTGYGRTVELRPHELMVEPIKAKGKQPEPRWRNALTQLPAGRYCYQHGQLYRIKP